MKKHIILAIILVLFFASCTKNLNYEFPILPETSLVMGNASYQLIENSDKTLNLYNMKYNISIINMVEQYKKINNNVICKGKYKKANVYSIVDGQQNKLFYFVENNDQNFDIDLRIFDNIIESGDLVLLDCEGFLEKLFSLGEIG